MIELTPPTVHVRTTCDRCGALIEEGDVPARDVHWAGCMSARIVDRNGALIAQPDLCTACATVIAHGAPVFRVVPT